MTTPAASATNPSVIEPGSAIGVLGSGQLGRMFAIAGRRMGYRVHTFSPDADTPAGQVSDVEVEAPYDDLDRLAEFAKQVKVVSFEFENVPVEAIECVSRYAPVRPGGHVLHTTQNRLREKTFLSGAGLPLADFAPVESEEQMRAAAESVGFPAVLKTASWGYDGRGQRFVNSVEEMAAAFETFEHTPCVLEKRIELDREISVVAARDTAGTMVCFNPAENLHRNHILYLSTSPASVDAATAAQATEITRTIAEQLDVVGVFCVEFFVATDGTLLVNEIAPRPHNSGHLTVDTGEADQFEQQVRAVCGLPLGVVETHRPIAMVNLLGDCWDNGTPDWSRALAVPGVKLHLYGKSKVVTGRKMGHLTASADTIEEAADRVQRARQAAIDGAT